MPSLGILPQQIHVSFGQDSFKKDDMGIIWCSHLGVTRLYMKGVDHGSCIYGDDWRLLEGPNYGID